MKRVVFLLLAAASVFTLSAQTNALDTSGAAPPPSAPAKKGAAELEKLVEPIALHPDPLIAIILPASAYPLEVVQAARFVKDTNNIAKLDQQPWDDNVKAVAEFPALISKMDADLAWTTELGQAFIDQPKELMDAIQSLRNKAQTAGTLKTSEQQIVVVTNVIEKTTVQQQVVVVTNTIVQIQPSNPQVIYVPTYPPTVYYPPPTYVYDPYAPLIAFGVGIAVGAIIANNCDWHGGCVYHNDYHGGDVNVNVDRNVNRNVNRNTGARPTPYSGNRTGGTKWQPDQSRLRTSGAPPSAQTREARGWGGGAQASQRPAGGAGAGAGAGATRPSQLPAAGAGGARPSQLPAAGAGGARPSQTPSGGAGGGFGAQQPGYQQPSAGTTPARSQGAGQGARPSQQPSAGARPAQSPSVNRAPSQGSSAFGGANSSNARNASNRGAASRGGGGGGGRGGGGGGRGGGGRR